MVLLTHCIELSGKFDKFAIAIQPVVVDCMLAFASEEIDVALLEQALLSERHGCQLSTIHIRLCS